MMTMNRCQSRAFDQVRGILARMHGKLGAKTAAIWAIKDKWGWDSEPKQNAGWLTGWLAGKQQKAKLERQMRRWLKALSHNVCWHAFRRLRVRVRVRVSHR